MLWHSCNCLISTDRPQYLIILLTVWSPHGRNRQGSIPCADEELLDLLLGGLHRKRCCQTNALSRRTRKMTLAYLSLPQFPHLGHEVVVAHPWRRLHPCKQVRVLIRRIDCCELRTSGIRSGRSASPAVAVGRSKHAICKT